MSMQAVHEPTYGEDASVDAAVGKLLGKITPEDVETIGPTTRRAPEKETKRASTERDVTDIDGSTDLEEAEAAERQAKASGTDDEGDGKAGAGGDKAEDEFELPAETEGGEVEKIPRAQVIEAIRAQRQIQGGVAEAINKAEAEYIGKQDEALGSILKMHGIVRERAEAVLRTIPTPQRPSRDMLNPQSQNYDPQTFLLMEKEFDDQVSAYNHYVHSRNEAKKAEDATRAAVAEQTSTREFDRLSRHKGYEGWAKPETRAVAQKAMLDSLQKHFGVTAEEVGSFNNHKLILLAATAVAAKEAATKAPVVRKELQEGTPKITRTQATPTRDANTGKFTSEARERLRSEGSEDAFADLLLKSGAL